MNGNSLVPLRGVMKFN